MPPSEFWGTDTWTVMDAYDGYCISKGIKHNEPVRPGADDVRRWRAMIDAEGKGDE